MPTTPDPNSPFLDTRLAAEFGMRMPGTPSSAGKPGPQAADLSFPAPPAVNTAPPGRPVEVAPPAPTPQARPAQKPPTQQGAPPAQPAQPGAQAMPPPGQKTQVGVGADGSVTHTLTPEGDLAYRQSVLRLREQLGPIPRVFMHPNLPELPVEPGVFNYNPFTDQFTRGE